jgi:hypothetical protein
MTGSLSARALRLVLAVCLVGVGGTAVGCRCAPEVPLPILQEPEDFWPLTGELAPDAASLERRAISLKIENTRASRPQSGLAQADVVYETLSEGGITRFNAIYHSQAPEVVGPIRSARAVDIDVISQYNALFAYSGASQAIRQMLATAGVDDIGFERFSAPYRRVDTRQAPHNLYSGIPDLLETAEGAGFDVTQPPVGLEFGDAPASATTTATSISIPFSNQAQVAWEWDATQGQYERLMDGLPHGDQGSEQPYQAANVVVIMARTVETGATDAVGTPTLDIELTGTGDAVVFRDGYRYEATWTGQQTAPPTFTTRDGETLPLAPGRTWFEVVPLGFGVDSQ